MNYDTVKPFQKIRTRYVGKAYHLPHPYKMSDPKKLFQTEKPKKKAIQFIVEHYGIGELRRRKERLMEVLGSVYGKKEEKSKDEFAKNHYEQHMEVRG